MRSFKVNKKYTHFCVNNATGKIVDAWEYPKHFDMDDIKDYYKLDMADNDRSIKEHKLKTVKQLTKAGIDPFDWTSWANS